MDEDDEEVPQQKGKHASAAPPPVDAGNAQGPIYLMWENTLEKLKILNYEGNYCEVKGRKFFDRIYFIFPASNLGTQFDDFMDIASWLCSQCTSKGDVFKRETYDDPSTLANKLMLALRELQSPLNIPTQALRKGYGEHACSVLEFLADKALAFKKIAFQQPVYLVNTDAEAAPPEDDNQDILDDIDGVPVEEELLHEDGRLEMSEVSLDSSAHQILLPRIDPIEWKIELERVGPKLRSKQQSSMNEWRAHVDMTVSSKSNIEKVLGETQGDLSAMNKEVSEELNKMRSKERYMNNQYSTLCHEYKEVKQRLEELEAKSSSTNEKVVKLTNELAEVNERLEELKESFESKDSGMHDTSPLVRIKAALQQIKAEVHQFDLRIGVVAHSVLVSRINTTQRRRLGAIHKNKRKNKSKKDYKDSFLDNSGGEEEY